VVGVTAQSVTVRNTADHWFAPGDSGQDVTHGDTEYRVVSVMAATDELILTYGLRLIPAVVTLVLEADDQVVQ
jgi:hypothetical protein